MDHSEPSDFNRRGKQPGTTAGDGVTSGTHEGAFPAGSLALRQAVPADLADLLALEETFPSDKLSRRAMRRHLANQNVLCLVAHAGDRLLGYVLLLRRSDSPYRRLYSLVRAGDAPRGTGRRLLEAALDAARQGSAKGVRLEVREDNTAAIRLYESLGFALFATTDGYYEDGARALRMALDFGA
jgi:[ribosomal protein S18]-alanine N-acetyltransferase